MKFPCTGKFCNSSRKNRSLIPYPFRERQKAPRPTRETGRRKLRIIYRQNAKQPHPEPQKSEYLGRDAFAAPSISMNAECMQPCSWQCEECRCSCWKGTPALAAFFGSRGAPYPPNTAMGDHSGSTGMGAGSKSLNGPAA